MSEGIEFSRNVRRRVSVDFPTLSPLFADINCSLLHQSFAFGQYMHTLRQHVHRTIDSENTNVYLSSADSSQNRTQEKMDGLFRSLVSWSDLGMPPYDGLSEGRKERWANYCCSERWVYYTVHLMNDVLRWRSDDKAAFLFIPHNAENIIGTNCYEQITFIMALAQFWNSRQNSESLLKVNLCSFCSLEHLWFGYLRSGQDGEDCVVHMIIDQAEADSRMIVNRLECGEDFNDFECIAYQNTLTQDNACENNKPAPLSDPDLRCMLLVHFVNALLEEYQEFVELHSSQQGGEFSEDVTRDLQSFHSHIWQCVAMVHSWPTDTSMGTVVALLVGTILHAGIAPTSASADPDSTPLLYRSALQAFSCALEGNPANYEARRYLVECYLDIGEVFLAHQHCLVLVEQLSEYASAALEAPKAHIAFAYAAELISTTLQEIHGLHERGEEGYEQLDHRIPTIGDFIDVEWALDEELVRYRGKIDLHPDGRSLCISYADDTEPGTHRRRFENALHLVNINDAHDQYLETFYFVDDSQVN